MLLRRIVEPIAAVSKQGETAELGAEVCAWSGPVDGVVVEFEAWLDRKFRELLPRQAS